jgi:hypothetical protein
MSRRNKILALVLMAAMSALFTNAVPAQPAGPRKTLATRPGSAPPPSSTDNGAPQQDGRRGPQEWGPPPRPEFRPPPFEMFSDNKVVKGAPYSATVLIETVQTLANGAKLTHKKTDVIYRDSEGRVRREQTFDRVGPFPVDGEPRQIVFINDAVQGVRIVLDPSQKTARKAPGFDRGGPPFRPPPPPADMDRKTESLGKQMIEGVEAEGTRITITFPAGKIGNDRPLESVVERWESSELQVVVLSKHSDPIAGETTYRLTEIKRAEPARSLFEIPTDYTLEQAGPGRSPWGDRRKRPHE